MSATISQSDDDTIALHAHDVTRSTSAIISEGVLAGMIAAAAVALAFLAIDAVSGQAFRTPQQLGAMLLTLIGSSSGDLATSLALYTVFHFGAFIVAGIVAAAIVQVTMKQPVAILLFVILFFAFEVAFTGFVAFLDTQSTGTITPYQVALGNVVASVAMALFFRARHPALKHLGHVLDGEE